MDYNSRSVHQSSTNLLPYAAGTVTAVIIFIFFATFLRRSRTSPPQPPGPIGFPILGSLPFLEPQLHSFFATLASIHGPIYSLRLGSKLALVISSPTLAREVLRDHDSAFANRDVPAAARIIAYGGSDIVWSPNGPTWRMLRRICVREMLSPISLDTVYHFRRRELRAAVRHLYNVAAEQKPVNVGEEMFLVILNVITSMLWGGTVEGDEERGTVGKEFREVVGDITELLGLPNISDFFPGLARFDLQGIERKMKLMLVRFDGLFARIIEAKKKRRIVGDSDARERMDFLDYMLKLEMEESHSKTPFKMTHIKALLMDMVVGGSETSSNTLEFALAEMMRRPETMKRAQEELDLVVGKDSIVEEFHISKLHYLSMVIKEALRLHPALPLLVPHCPSCPCTVGGYAVPAGSRIFVNVWAIHRDPTMWKDPLEFRPERFAETARKLDYTGNDFSFIPFGSGRRICAGISMAERMVTYLLASLLHSFDWKVPDGTELHLAEKFGIVLKKAKPLVAIPIPRLSNPELYG